MTSLLTILAAGEPRVASAPSSYMPSVRVEIAWNAGYLTAASLRTWTDVTDYVEGDQGITITGGRQDERSTADANHLTLTFDNSDGRFTFGKTSGAYGSNVKLGRPIRVIADPVDGVETVRFLGFIDELPTEWSDGTDATAYATISATSRLARLGTQAALKSIVETVVLADSPIAYYTLGEPEGSTQANDSSGAAASAAVMVAGRAGSTTTDVVFGSATGPGTDGLTAAIFAGGKYLVGHTTSTAPAGGISVEAFFLASSAVQGQVVSAEHIYLAMTSAGKMQAAAGVPGTGLTFVNSPNTYADGAIHHAASTWDGTTIRLYVDGALVASIGEGSAVSPIVTVAVGADSVSATFAGTVAHAAFYAKELSAASILSHYTAGFTAYAGETTSARLIRYGGYAGIESAAISAETGQTTVQHVDTTDQHAVDLMRVMETTEGGVLFDAPDGITTFHNRAHRLSSAAAAFTLNMAQQVVEQDYAPKADRSAVANDITATDTSGRYSARRFDATSQTDNGVATMSIETASEDDDEPLFQAGWALYKYKDVRERVPALTVNALAQVGKTPNCAAVMAATVGTKITVSNRPTQASSSSVDYFVEGWSEVYGPESMFITWNLSPSSPEDLTLIIGDATRGFIGTNPIAL